MIVYKSWLVVNLVINSNVELRINSREQQTINCNTSNRSNQKFVHSICKQATYMIPLYMKLEIWEEKSTISSAKRQMKEK